MDKILIESFESIISVSIAIISLTVTIAIIILSQFSKIKQILSKRKKISTKKDVKNKKLSFDNVSGELVMKEVYNEPNEPNAIVVDQIYKDGFFGTNDKKLISKILAEKNTNSFENLHLSSYYNQTLNQSKISFWFSLIFAALGFTLIALAIVMYTVNSTDKTIITIVSGAVIDAISALFFVQSNNARKAVGAFFEKLRKDKQIHDAVDLAETISNKEIKDKLKVELSIQLIGLAQDKNDKQNKN